MVLNFFTKGERASSLNYKMIGIYQSKEINLVKEIEKGKKLHYIIGMSPVICAPPQQL